MEKEGKRMLADFNWYIDDKYENYFKIKWTERKKDTYLSNIKVGQIMENRGNQYEIVRNHRNPKPEKRKERIKKALFRWDQVEFVIKRKSIS